ncbi:MAG: sugar phosphate isomerase/epimerase [Clostridia bacterium]|nr:sugar phosphate isomerase/epimerase [Clostridia bacterium]
MKEFKLGINIQGGRSELTIPQHIELVKQIGWDAFFTSWDHNNVEKWAETGAKNGLIYTSLHAPFSHEYRIWNGGEDGEKEIATMIACIEDCARFDIPVVVLHTMNGFSPKTPAAPTQVGLDGYARIIEAGNRHGVKLAFENTEREEFLAAVMQKFWNEPCVGFCYDTGHEQCYRNSDMMALYGEKLCHTHFDDNLGVTGDIITWYDDSHLPMGDGIVDWKTVMERIEASPFEGVLSCELTTKNKPERNTHGAYVNMPIDTFYALTLERARRVRDRSL